MRRASASQEVGHRLIERDVVGVDVAADVLVPALHALRQRLHRDGVACLCCQVAEVEPQSGPLPVLRHAPHHVLAQLVVRIQEHVDFHHQQRFRRYVLQRFRHTLAPAVLLLVLLAIGILEHLLHQILVAGEPMAEEGQPLGNGHRDARLLTVVGQAVEQQMSALRFFCNTCHVVEGLRQTMFIDELHGMIVVDAGQQRLLLPGFGDDGLDGFRNVGAVGIERYGVFVEDHVWVAAYVTTARKVRLQLLDAHAQLHVVGQSRFLVEVHMEAADVVVRRG